METPSNIVESIVSLPVINPETGKASRTFRFAGKLDLGEGAKLSDYKSAKDPARFVKQQVIGFQLEFYAMAVRKAGRWVSEVEYRVIAVPGIKLCGKDADPQAYEQRCFEWLMDPEYPNRMMSHPFVLTDGRIKQAQGFMWECSKRILENRRNDRWLPNPGACFAWERPCEYLPLCELVSSSTATEDTVQRDYEEIHNFHPELGEAGADSGLLTHSSMSMLVLCEMKYFWRHEVGVRKRRDYVESLWLGSAMHAGMEGYATGGIDAGLAAVDSWRQQNPIVGEDDAKDEDQQVARARAMVRAAAAKWPMYSSV